MLGVLAGCASVRVTEPPRTATEQFLLTESTLKAIDKLSTTVLRDRKVYVDSTYLTPASAEVSFLLGELRAKLLESGVRLMPEKKDAQIILEVRAGALGIDRQDFLIGIPSIYIPGTIQTATGTPLATPELAIVKSTKQRGFTSVSYVAYWQETGEIVATSGPGLGRTYRNDFWILGFGPKTTGDIPTTQEAGVINNIPLPRDNPPPAPDK
jgi:hypothetical protein